MFSLLNVNPVAFENIFGTGRNIYWYGILIACGVLIGIWLAMWDAKRRGRKADMAIDMALWAVILAVVFARLYYVVFDTTGTFRNNFWEIFNISNGGLAIYGGIIGGLLGIWIYSRIKKLKLSILLDIAAPSLAFGQAIGRWGNFFNQEAFGHPVTEPGLQWFPYAVYFDNPKGNFSAGWFQATFFYESMWCLLICIFLILYRRRQRFSGEVMTWYFLLYGFERALVELLRTDQLWIPGTRIPVSSVLSAVLFVAAGIILLVMHRKARRGEVAPLTPGSIYYRAPEEPVCEQAVSGEPAAEEPVMAKSVPEEPEKSDFDEAQPTEDLPAETDDAESAGEDDGGDEE